jgi:hypothetical protein
MPSRTLWNRGFRVGAIAAGITCVLAAGIGVWTAHESRVPAPVLTAPATAASRPAEKSVESGAVGTAPTAIPPAHAELTGPSVAAAEIAQPNAIDPRDTAVDVLWILHREGLCRSGSVVVDVQAAGEVTVKGVIETGAQLSSLKVHLEEEVRGPFTWEVRAADEVSAAAGPGSVQPNAISRASAPAPLGDSLIENWLKAQHVEVNAELPRISNQIVNLANDAWAESWAVRHLVERFGPRQTGGLSHASKVRLAEMVRAHLEKLANAVGEENVVLGPLLGGGGGSTGDDARVTLGDVARLSELIQDTFAGRSQVQDTGRLRELLSAVVRASQRWESERGADWDWLVWKVSGVTY